MKNITSFEGFVTESTEGEKKYPSLSDIRAKLRYNLVVQVRKKVLGAFVVGSEAKGTARPDSDLDIAIVIEPIKNKSSLKFTDEYHSRFMDERWTPKWNGRKLDFQFFYPDDTDLDGYSKIELAKK
jgi:predicted nucleotidyltransferase